MKGLVSGKTNVVASPLSRRVDRRENRYAIRWYVLVLPFCHKGLANGLQAELDRRIKNGEKPFEYFAPSFVEVKKVDGVIVKTHRPLLYNYVFVRTSESEIYQIKQQLPQYNFLPRVKDEKGGYYPYLTDEVMENLRWVARSYSDVLPVYMPDPGKLVKGDKVRITEGIFKGMEASVVITAGAGHKDVMVCVENWLWVPLLRVLPGQYEVIALNTGNKHHYARLENDTPYKRMHEALCRYYGREGVTLEDRHLATMVLTQYSRLQVDSDVLRCRLYSLLLLAYTVTEQRQERDRLIGMIQTLLPLVKAEQARALLLVTLYGCTDSSIYHGQAHALVAPWRKEAHPKKFKSQLISRLDDYDRWLGHTR
ncbi:MAG: transcriptional regulator [Porphyromonadaceae bacterium]|nr:transcriptional regulator [Porphyromonadaceae bacterium]